MICTQEGMDVTKQTNPTKQPPMAVDVKALRQELKEY
jgi:hypothetical protein